MPTPKKQIMGKGESPLSVGRRAIGSATRKVSGSVARARVRPRNEDERKIVKYNQKGVITNKEMKQDIKEARFKRKYVGMDTSGKNVKVIQNNPNGRGAAQSIADRASNGRVRPYIKTNDKVEKRALKAANKKSK